MTSCSLRRRVSLFATLILTLTLLGPAAGSHAAGQPAMDKCHHGEMAHTETHTMASHGPCEMDDGCQCVNVCQPGVMLVTQPLTGSPLTAIPSLPRLAPAHPAGLASPPWRPPIS